MGYFAGLDVSVKDSLEPAIYRHPIHTKLRIRIGEGPVLRVYFNSFQF